jgi:transcriptional regulator with XRE-family HTH domain
MGIALKEKIIERMDAKNLSIAELERRAGLSIHSVRNILKGRIKKPSAQSLHAIAEALECSILDLMNTSSSIHEGFPQDIEKRTKRRPPLDYPDLLLECSQKVLNLLIERNCKISLDEFFEIIRKVYLYSSREEPRQLDMRFTEWLIETQFDHNRSIAKG